MSYVMRGTTHENGYVGVVGVRCNVCKLNSAVCVAFGRDEDGTMHVHQNMDTALREVRNMLDTAGWDCSPSEDPLSADYCPDCAQTASHVL